VCFLSAAVHQTTVDKSIDLGTKTCLYNNKKHVQHELHNLQFKTLCRVTGSRCKYWI